MTLVLGTAGHVDHGKTALVLALTGRDTDRLPAEKARGISIELGFAPLRLPSGRRLSLIDVPGHERFVRHMVAGASGVDGFLLCLAADDGVMPQTREHLAVLDLLGVRDGVVAVTRADLADPAPAAAAVRDLVASGTEVIPVCAPRGRGIPELVAALDRLAGRLAPRRAGGASRLFVDRAFTVAGAGTVVTGTLWGAPVARGDRVVVHPSGATGRVRGVQVHDAPVERAGGGRVALALVRVPREAVPRGSCVVLADDPWTPAGLLGTRLRWLPDAGGDLAGGRRLQVFLGTAEVPAACAPLEPLRIPPGGEGWALLRLARPVPALAGDRVVVRASGRTLGGGEVVDPHPPGRAGRADRVARLRVLAGLDEPAAAPPPAAHVEAPAGEAGALDPALEALARLLEDAGLRPPPPHRLGEEAGLSPAELREALGRLRAAGRAAPAGDLWFAPAALDDAAARARAALAERPLAVAELRDLWGVGRRGALAIAAHLDARGVTVRRGDVRILRRGERPGPGGPPRLQNERGRGDPAR